MHRSDPRFPVRTLLAALLVVVTSRAATSGTHDDLATLCGVHSPEDVEWVKSLGLLLVSEVPDARPGAIAALEIDDPTARLAEPRTIWPMYIPGPGLRPEPSLGERACTEAVARDPGPLVRGFAPHGIHSRRFGDAIRVVAVDHRDGTETIDVFELARGVLVNTPDRPVLTWRACITMPPGTRGNDIALTPDGDVVVANVAPKQSIRYFMKARWFGGDTGDLRRWRTREQRWEIVPGTAARAPNGVFVADDGRIFFSESGSGLVREAPDASSGRPPLFFEIGGIPDNLAPGPDGSILAATHGSLSAFVGCSFHRASCHSPWSLFAIDPAPDAKPRELLRHDGSVLGAVSSAAFVDGRYVLGSVFGESLGVWDPAAQTARSRTGDR
jgi:hypothetical protein